MYEAVYHDWTGQPYKSQLSTFYDDTENRGQATVCNSLTPLFASKVVDAFVVAAIKMQLKNPKILHLIINFILLMLNVKCVRILLAIHGNRLCDFESEGGRC